VAGGVEHFRHLAVVGAVGAVTEGFVGVLVLEGFGFALASAGLSVGGGRSGECGVVGVKVPSRRGELVPRGSVVEQVGGVCSVCRSQFGE
jgi:hypothetical protein